MARVTHHYDLVVLGSDLAGLVAAALAARRGKRVLLLPHGAADGSFEFEAGAVPIAGHPLPWVEAEPVRLALRELGLATQIRRAVGPCAGTMQFARPGSRTTWSPPAFPAFLEAQPPSPAGGESSKRSVPLEAEAVEAAVGWVDEVAKSLTHPRTNPFETRRVAQRLERLARGITAPPPGGATFARAVLPWVVDLHPDQAAAPVALAAAAAWLPSPRALAGGEAALRRHLLKVLALHGGDVRPDLRVDGIHMRRGKVDEVSFAGRPTRYGLEHLAVAGADLALTPLLGVPIVAEGRLQVAARRYALHLSLDPKGVGPGPGDLLLVASPAPWAEALGPAASALLAFRRSPAGPTHVCVEATVPPDTDRSTLRETVLDWLDDSGILPFLRRHVRCAHSPHDGLPPTEGHGRPLISVGTFDGPREPMPPVLAGSAPPLLGVLLVPTRTEIKNLHLCSRINAPGLGIAGSFAVGQKVASAVAAPERSPLARTPMLRRP